MSDRVGIVTEYNPFHTGHLYQLDCLKKAGYEDIVVCMSGACVQRGQLAMLSKFTRAQMALQCGVSVVAEIPSVFSLRSAEGYRIAGMQTLRAMNVDAVAFGAETDDIALLTAISDYLLSDDYETSIKQYLDCGMTFAEAREKSVFDRYEISADVLRSSNNILAIEYIKACKKLGWAPRFIVIKRQGADYNNKKEQNGFASATGIRNAVSEYRFDFADNYIPDEAKIVWKNALDRGEYFTENDTSYEKALLYKLRTSGYNDFIHIPDCNEELRHSMEKASSKAVSYEQFMSFMPTKRYTRRRINRILTQLMAGIDDSFPADIQYIRILGVRKDKEDFLGEISRSCPLPVSHSVNIICEKSELCKKIAQAESSAVDIQSAFFKLSGEPKTDYTTKFLKI